MFNITSLGNCKLQQWDTTTQLSTWLRSKTLTPRSDGKGVEQEERSSTAGGNAAAYSDTGNQFGSFLTELHMLLPYDPAIMLLGVCPTDTKTCPYKNVNANAYSSFIQNCQNLEATKMSSNRWMEKQTGTFRQWNIIQWFKPVVLYIVLL